MGRMINISFPVICQTNEENNTNYFYYDHVKQYDRSLLFNVTFCNELRNEHINYLRNVSKCRNDGIPSSLRSNKNNFVLNPIEPAPTTLDGNSDINNLICSPKWLLDRCHLSALVGYRYRNPCTSKYSNKGLLCNKSGLWTVQNSSHCSMTALNIVQIFHTVGNILSFTCLIAAIIIFLSFRCLRCLRNIIHCHFFAVLAMRCLASEIYVQCVSKLISLRFFTALSILHISRLYFDVSSCSWMLSEGIYLVSVTMFPFNMGNHKQRIYASITWLVPVLPIATWFSVRNYYCHLYEGKSSLKFYQCLLALKYTLPKKNIQMFFNYLELIWTVPIFVTLVVNLLLLLIILTKIIMMLRENKQESNRFDMTNTKKLLKALLIVFPLLGIPFLLTLHKFNGSFIIQLVSNAYQGLIIAIVLCFSNKEVRDTLRRKWFSKDFNMSSSLFRTQGRSIRVTRKMSRSKFCSINQDLSTGTSMIFRKNSLTSSLNNRFSLCQLVVQQPPQSTDGTSSNKDIRENNDNTKQQLNSFTCGQDDDDDDDDDKNRSITNSIISFALPKPDINETTHLTIVDANGGHFIESKPYQKNTLIAKQILRRKFFYNDNDNTKSLPPSEECINLTNSNKV
ncbi:hypothetical protein SNEBB_009428 [Seison nebaliae]|nr:hypothetical protein SNEBB_009428 [Seison nebaliae]